MRLDRNVGWFNYKYILSRKAVDIVVRNSKHDVLTSPHSGHLTTQTLLQASNV